MSPHCVRLLEHALCQWHDCRECEGPRRFDHPDAGVQWLKTFRHDDSAMRQMREIARRFDDDRSLSRATDEELCERLGWLLHSDRLRVCGTNPVTRSDFGVRKPRADPVPMPRPVRRPIAEPPAREPIEDATFDAQVDTAAMVRDLIEAASLGLAFCEECERQQAQPPRPDAAPSEFPPALDPEAAVAALIAAASSGVPFCEECERRAVARSAA